MPIITPVKTLEIVLAFEGQRFTIRAHENHVAGVEEGGVVIFRSPVTCLMEFTNHNFFGMAYMTLPKNIDVPLRVLAENQETDFKVWLVSEPKSLMGPPPPIITP